MSGLLPALKQRRAKRAFSKEPVSAADLQILWEAVSLAPSHGNTQPTRILLATPEQHEEMVAALSEGNQKWAGSAPVLIGFASFPDHSRPVANRDGSVRELWGLNSGIALGNLLTQATAMGLIAHPMAGFDEPSVRAVFGAPEDLRILVVVAIGHPGELETLPEDLRARETAQQERMALDRLVVHGKWTEAHGESAREQRDKRG